MILCTEVFFFFFWLDIWWHQKYRLQTLCNSYKNPVVYTGGVVVREQKYTSLMGKTQPDALDGFAIRLLPLISALKQLGSMGKMHK